MNRSRPTRTRLAVCLGAPTLVAAGLLGPTVPLAHASSAHASSAQASSPVAHLNQLTFISSEVVAAYVVTACSADNTGTLNITVIDRTRLGVGTVNRQVRCDDVTHEDIVRVPAITGSFARGDTADVFVTLTQVGVSPQPPVTDSRTITVS
ncbi:hypothetical protein KALB_5845 [Kutzneria albida DSM 43870]|uniref:Secreted protein n=1 Tax=Kutzneria albida DSM 43870 TaxID=1449976 RepID=W5WF55_9PSEU|nr:hypothetical protein KALB_5845 [Kutzneria albida DSM 43870]